MTRRLSFPLAEFVAMPSAQAGRAPHRAMLHCLGHTAPILIAGFALATFAASFIMGAAR